MPQSDFWSQFPQFTQDPTAPFKAEFGRLASFMGWIRRSDEHRDAWIDCTISELDFHLDFAGKRLVDWHSLCETMNIAPLPPSITKCKKALKRVNVNILDLLDALRGHQPVRKFQTRAGLAEYTRGKKRYVPPGAAKADGIVKALLKKF